MIQAVWDVNNSRLKAEALWSVFEDRHLRAVYCARCPADRLSKPTEIPTCIQVAVLLVSTRACKQVAIALSCLTTK